MSTHSWIRKLFTRTARSRRTSPSRLRPALATLEDRLAPAIFTVANINDSGAGSLRQAVFDANASPGNDTVDFDSTFSTPKTILLTTGPISLTQGTTIAGPGANLVSVSGNNVSRVFNTRGLATIAGLTITGGNKARSLGGGIYSESTDSGALTVRDCVVTGNTAFWGGGIYIVGYPLVDSGGAKVINSTISGNTAVNYNAENGSPFSSKGGGIYVSQEAVFVDKSTISGNSAGGFGGGLYSNDGAPVISNSTFSGNVRGAVWASSATISNSTFSGNDEGLDLATGNIANSTITGSVFGISCGGVTMNNSIVVGNLYDISGFVDGRNNLIGETQYSGGLINGVNGNLVGVPNPGLGPLTNNGGPTMTHALRSLSPAINRGDNALIPIDFFTDLPFTTDQTGAARIFNGDTVDIGAVEFQATLVPSMVVNTTTDDDVVNTLTSLREAVFFATLSGGAVTFDPTVFATPQTIQLDKGPVIVDARTAAVTIDGPGAGLLSVDAGGTSQVFRTFGTTTISGLTITGGGGDSTGAIDNQTGMLTIHDSVISGNAISGILNEGTLSVFNSTLSDNQGNYGGAIRNGVDPGNNATATISNSTIAGNTASYSGGGIDNRGRLTIYDSTITDNSANNDAGGISGDMTISNSTISGNTAGRFGGGILGFVTISNSTISGNTAFRGGGIQGTGTISNSTISENTAFQGGGIFTFSFPDDHLTISHSIVAGNDNGAGLPTDLELDFGTVTGAYNLIGDAATAGGLVNGVNGNIVGANPLLGPLADNGGPTMTHALLSGSPAINAGDPAFNPNAFTPPMVNDQRGAGFDRVVAGRPDIGAFEGHYAAPTIVSTVVGNGAAQRSRVTELTVTFSTQVTIPNSAANIFALTRDGGGAVNFTAMVNIVGGVSVVTLNGFTGPETQFGSLRDGRYTLAAPGSQIFANGIQMGYDYTFGDAQGLFRFFGDVNGDRRLDISDFGQFSATYNRSTGDPAFNAIFDFNGDGRIDISDFGQFSVRFFTTLP